MRAESRNKRSQWGRKASLGSTLCKAADLAPCMAASTTERERGPLGLTGVSPKRKKKHGHSHRSSSRCNQQRDRKPKAMTAKTGHGVSTQ